MDYETLRAAYEDAYVADSPVWVALTAHHDAELAAEVADLEAARNWVPDVQIGGPPIDAAMYDQLLADIEAKDRVIPGVDYRVRFNGDDQERRRRYGDAVLYDECARMARAEPGTRSNTLISVAYRVGRLIPGGMVDTTTGAGELLDAALATGIPEREARNVIARGLRAGERNPRELE